MIRFAIRLPNYNPALTQLSQDEYDEVQSLFADKEFRIPYLPVVGMQIDLLCLLDDEEFDFEFDVQYFVITHLIMGRILTILCDYVD